MGKIAQLLASVEGPFPRNLGTWIFRLLLNQFIVYVYVVNNPSAKKSTMFGGDEKD